MMSLAIANLAMLYQQTPGHPEMTTGGWVFMIVSWVAILWVTFYTFARILRKR
jgi:hypothetical protein